MRLATRAALIFLTTVVMGAMALSGCDDSPTTPEPVILSPIPEPTSPENVLRALEAVYDDTTRTSTERVAAYSELLTASDHASLPEFVFQLAPEDAIEIGDPSWRVAQELDVHRRMFTAQDEDEIFSLSVDLTLGAPVRLPDPGNGQGDWRQISVTTNLRLLFAPDDGLAVNGGQSQFVLAPADDRWFLSEWIDLPTPSSPRPDGEPGAAVERATWGSIKAAFRQPIGTVIPPPTTPEKVIAALEIIYNEDSRSARERSAAYSSLFPPETHPTLDGFVFRLQADDATELGRETWGLAEELRVHDSIFAAEDSRVIYDLRLDMITTPATPLDFPGSEQEDWQQILATNVNLTLLFTADDGLAVRGEQARFLLAPSDGRWYLSEWIDLPAPEPRGAASVGVAHGRRADGTALTVEQQSWGSIKARFGVPPLPGIPAPTSPENLVRAIEVIYDDTVRSASERRDVYRDLFPPNDHPTVGSFLFRLQPDDAIEIGQESWGVDQETRIHEAMFGAQDNREIFSLALDITHGAATPIDSPAPGQEGWMELFASDVNLRLLFSPDDGLAVNGAQARFFCAPADERWYVAEWVDLPSPVRPHPRHRLVELTSWGSVKAAYK